jgi:hypothetical protein
MEISEGSERHKYLCNSPNCYVPGHGHFSFGIHRINRLIKEKVVQSADVKKYHDLRAII